MAQVDVCFWCGRYGVQIPSRSNLSHVANDSPLVQSRWDEHRSLVTPERVLSEYNEDLIFLFDLK